MILCSDYNPDECPIECLYASNTEGYIQQSQYTDYFTTSCLYGTDACSLNRRKEPMFGVSDKLNEIRKSISNAVDEALAKILSAADISITYFELNPEEFKLETMRSANLFTDTEQYKLYHRDTLLGIVIVRMEVPDFDGSTSINVEVKYIPVIKD